MAAELNAKPDRSSQSTPLTRGAVFLQLVAFIKANRIPCCILGDTRAFPEEIRSDVDIVVAAEALLRMSELLARFCAERNLLLVQMLEHELTARYYALAWTGVNQLVCFLNPDICSDFYHIGRFYISAGELLAGSAEAVNELGTPLGFQVASPATDFIYYLIKKIDKLDLCIRSGAHLSSQWRKNPSGAMKNLQRFWPEADVKFLAAAAENNLWEPVIGRLRQLQQSLRRGRRFCLRTTISESLRKLRRALRPTGLLVAFVGPDGSGKSTVIERTLVSMAPAFRHTTRIHLRPRLGKKQPDRVVSDPHAKESYGFALSLVKLLYLWIDYTAGYSLKVYPRLARSTLVLFDRYYHDLLVDPKRYRLSPATLPIARLIARFIPRPRLWIILDSPAEILHQRKQELSLEETVRQRGEYLNLAKVLPNTTVINSAQPLDAVILSIGQEIVAVLSDRTRMRLGIAEPNALREKRELFNL